MPLVGAAAVLIVLVVFVFAPVVAYSRAVEVLDRSTFVGFGIQGYSPNFTSAQETAYGSLSYSLLGFGAAPSFRTSYSFGYFDQGTGRNATLTVIYRDLPTPDLAISPGSPTFQVESIQLRKNDSALGGVTLTMTIKNLSSEPLSLYAQVDVTSSPLFTSATLSPSATATYSFTVWPPSQPQVGQHCQVVILAFSGTSELYTRYWAQVTVAAQETPP